MKNIKKLVGCWLLLSCVWSGREEVRSKSYEMIPEHNFYYITFVELIKFNDMLLWNISDFLCSTIFYHLPLSSSSSLAYLILIFSFILLFFRCFYSLTLTLWLDDMSIHDITRSYNTRETTTTQSTRKKVMNKKFINNLCASQIIWESHILCYIWWHVINLAQKVMSSSSSSMVFFHLLLCWECFNSNNITIQISHLFW